MTTSRKPATATQPPPVVVWGGLFVVRGTWTDPGGDDWDVETWWTINEDVGFGCVHLAFTASDGCTAMTSVVWRAPLGALLDEHREQVLAGLADFGIGKPLSDEPLQV